MSKFIIKGGKKLNGEISVNGAKNAALKILPASILSDQEITINNMPEIEDISRMVELLKEIGASVEKNGRTYKIKTSKIKNAALDQDLVKKIRASVMLVGPLLVRYGEVSFSAPGGDKIGQRPIDFFLEGFKKMGADVSYNKGAYYLKSKGRLKGCTYFFPKISHTVTESLMMTAVLAQGTTVLKNAACEPEIVALAEYLNKCGAKITGAGTHTIEIVGVNKITADVYDVMPDRLEAGSFSVLGALCGGELKITNCNPSHLDALWAKFDAVGVRYELGENYVKVYGGENYKAVDIQTHEYPGFPTDLQQPFTVLLTQCEGMSIVHEVIYDGRLYYTDILRLLGARIIMCDPHRIVINGRTKLHGTDIYSTDIRAGIALVIAGLAAKGKTSIGNIYQIDRGYEKIEERLQKIGADIKRIN